MSARGQRVAGHRVGGWRVAGRLARRETLHRPGRTLLVALLIAVPVGGMVVTDVVVRTEQQSPVEEWRLEWGAADAYTGQPLSDSRMQVVRVGETAAAAPAVTWPEGTETLSFRSEAGRLLRTDAGRRARAQVFDLPMADPLGAQIMQLMWGRAPTAAGEVFLTRSLAEDLGVDVGSVLALERPAAMAWTVVGVGERRSDWGADAAVLGPGSSFPWRAPAQGASGATTVLADLPADMTPAAVADFSRAYPGVALAPDVDPAPPLTPHDDGAGAAVAWSWVGGAVVLTVVSIVIAAAFAAGARRQLTTLGQLAANGAPQPLLRTTLLLQGTWTGALGAVLGMAIAAVGLAAGHGRISSLLRRQVDGYRGRLSDLVPIVVLGVAAATVAALVPARSASRVPVLVAMAGRRPAGRVPQRLTVAGLGLGAAGLALLGLSVLGGNDATSGQEVWTLTAIIGGVGVLLGACAVAPGYVSLLEPLAARLGGKSRLAARSLARQRTRTGAVVSAVCATSALAIAASSLLLTATAADAAEEQRFRDDELQLTAMTRLASPAQDGSSRSPGVDEGLVARLGEAISADQIVRVPVGMLPDGENTAWSIVRFAPQRPRLDQGVPSLGAGKPLATAVIADEDFLGLYDFTPAMREALDKDGAIGISTVPGVAQVVATTSPRAPTVPKEVAGGAPTRPQVVATETGEPFTVRVFDEPAMLTGLLPGLIVTPERAAQMGLVRIAGPVVLRASTALTGAQRVLVQDLIEEHNDVAGTVVAPTVAAPVDYFFAVPPDATAALIVEGVLAATALVLSVFVVAVSLALAASETRDERDVLAVVGASPAMVRSTSSRKALILTLLGSALAIPVGLLPVAVFVATTADRVDFVFPWRIVMALLIVVPVVAAVVTRAASAVALRVRPVRVSTMAFD